MPTSKTDKRTREEQLLHAVSEAIIVIDKKYKVTLFNKAAEKIFSISSQQAKGMNANDLIELYTNKNVPINLESFCFKKSERYNHIEDAVMQRRGKKYRVKINTEIIGNNSHEECVITLTNMTKIKELENTKDEFLSVASHELRTPMTIIKSYLWMISTEKHGKLSTKQKEYIKKAILSTERMIELINDILNISRIEQNAINVVVNRVELVELTKELVSDFKVKADNKGLKLVINSEKDKHYAYVDTTKLREIFVNLVGNAVKFTDKGEVKVDIRRSGDFVKVSIIDTGRGIKQSELERLFHKFGRLDSSYQTVAESEGTGLGLYIVKLFVDAMGGKIGVFSEGSGKGSTFWFTLPKKRDLAVKKD